MGIVSDVGGAQKCGFQGVLVRTGKFRPSDEHHPEVKPDMIVNNLSHFADVLLAWPAIGLITSILPLFSLFAVWIWQVFFGWEIKATLLQSLGFLLGLPFSSFDGDGFCPSLLNFVELLFATAYQRVWDEFCLVMLPLMLVNWKWNAFWQSFPQDI